jgi:beta-glucanase (GH16 family)
MSLLGIKLKLGFFPNAEKIDRQHDALLKEYNEYVAYSQSEELARFEYLNKYLISPEFEEMENNPDIDRAKIEEIKSEFELLKKSPGLVGYLKSKSQEAKFIPVKSWKLEFEDHFTGDKLDSKWLTRYYWGDKLLKDSYSLPGDQQCNTNGKNIGLSGSKLSILTQREVAKGFSWNPLSGFVFREFPYTSGVINTSKSFRHIYGKVEAKIKIPKGNGYHAFWLAGERMLPQVNIFKYTGKKFYLENFWGNMADPKGIKKDNTKVTGAFAERYCIFTLEWTPKQLQWSINGVVFKTSQQGIPSEPMYIAFGSGVENDARLTRPVKLEIDWVRFYSKA